jgi:hypothetical protein
MPFGETCPSRPHDRKHGGARVSSSRIWGWSRGVRRIQAYSGREWLVGLSQEECTCGLRLLSLNVRSRK